MSEKDILEGLTSDGSPPDFTGLTMGEQRFYRAPFMDTPAARGLRMQAEYVGPESAFREHGISNTIVVFGSARSIRPEDLPANATQQQRYLAEWHGNVRELSRRLAEWGKDRSVPFYIATGGGPGMMLAANEGAYLAGARNIGMPISLPFEEHPNAYVTPGLLIPFHYFAMRKFWLSYFTKAFIAAPGGFGTLDELFEVLTLIQTRKMKKSVPVVLFGKRFWEPTMAMARAMADCGTINHDDLDLVYITDEVDDAFEYIVSALASAETAQLLNGGKWPERPKKTKR